MKNKSSLSNLFRFEGPRLINVLKFLLPTIVHVYVFVVRSTHETLKDNGKLPFNGSIVVTVEEAGYVSSCVNTTDCLKCNSTIALNSVGFSIGTQHLSHMGRTMLHPSALDGCA